MAEEHKKISFGFSKLVKKPSVLLKKPVVDKNVEIIECLEGQTIRIKDAVVVENKPLVIPLNDSAKNLLDRVREVKKAKEIKETAKETCVIDNRPDCELTIEELAARELLKDAQKAQELKNSTKVHTLPVDGDKFVADGQPESTLEDYENVPISDFGMALLRGMGWAENVGIGKKPQNVQKPEEPELRPKGLGLGANKMAKLETLKVAVDKEGKELKLIKGAFAKIIAGKNKGFYCEVQGFDDESGRVIVKTAIKGEILSLNEFLVHPVAKEEFAKSSKVLNNATFEEYSEKSKVKEEKSSDSERKGKHKTKREDGLIYKKDMKHSIKREKSESPPRSKKYSSDRYQEGRRSRSKKRTSSPETNYKSTKYNEENSKSRHRRSRSVSQDRSKHKSKNRASSSSDDSDYYGRKSEVSAKKYGFIKERSEDSYNKKSKDRSRRQESSRSKHRSSSSRSNSSSPERRKKKKKKTTKSKKSRSPSRDRNKSKKNKYQSKSKKYCQSSSEDDSKYIRQRR